MARPTPFQRAWLHITNPADAHFSDFESHYARFKALGFDGIVLGNVHHGTHVDWSAAHDRYLREGRARGWLFTLMGWLTRESPTEQAKVAAKIMQTTKVARYMADAEDHFQADEFSDGGRSKEFLSTIRPLFSGQLAVTTYPGVDLDWPVWAVTYKARCYIQTFNNDAQRMWPANDAVNWAVAQGFPRSRTKPMLPCYKTSTGSRPDAHQLIRDAKAASTVGFSIYYANGALDVPEWFDPFGPAIGPTGIAREV